ncbi:MAG: hypothetical protein ACKOPS_20650, partial [Cyanobium sp.]
SFVTALPSEALSWLPLLSGLNLALGLGLALWTLLFLFRIVLTWYPQVDLSRGAMRWIGAPTRRITPLLSATWGYQVSTMRTRNSRVQVARAKASSRWVQASGEAGSAVTKL